MTQQELLEKALDFIVETQESNDMGKAKPPIAVRGFLFLTGRRFGNEQIAERS